MMFISVPKSDLVLHWLQRTYKVPRDQSGLSSQTPEAEELLIVCVCVFSHLYYGPCTIIFALTFVIQKTGPQINRAQCGALHTRSFFPHVDALQTFTCQRRLGQAGVSPKCCSGGRGVFTYVIITLTPHLHMRPFRVQTKGDTQPPGSFFGLTQHTSSSSFLSNYLATAAVTWFPLRTVYFHQDIFP